ncbi:ZYBA0S05-01332g1_1 [Zygosaccharomyces bailii CLIB 213]|uniref:ZYBA0S05-01332g1_1 n=1 Tax=Zygosaccharomyces bailii (strain CLIB 213 / ATCC 58445 / CBS 680 / BCRC 21525 / NBRC 1098 / NCYC 1416 / NRRL Y-2227) TaxID=1333698 RepID=A0A8J2X863_ZYGB2|nr:ZYBA0S05-01332g1_1 [Zygosaccharomyces bailii CLIB 213]
MSTDTMYLDRSRVLTAAGKNRTNNVARLDKKRIQAEKRNKSRQQTGSSIPKTQVLPNGAKPDFGNSGSSRRSKKKGREENEAKDVTKSLKGLHLKDGMNQRTRQKNGRNEARPNSASSSDSSSITVSSTPPTGHTSPITELVKLPGQQAVPLMRPVSPLGAVQPGIHYMPQIQPPCPFPQGLPVPPLGAAIGAPLQVQSVGLQPLPLQPTCFGAPGFPYANYAAGSSHPGPYFMNPQAPLVNPMYPQMPLPVMQSQTEHRAPVQALSHSQVAQPEVKTPRTSSRPTSSKKTKKSTSFAGASFATKDPVINKLPKPSFA